MEDQMKDQKAEQEQDMEKALESEAEKMGEKIGKKIENYFESSAFKYFIEGFFGAFFTVLGTILIVAFWDKIALFNDDFSKMMDIIYITTIVNVIFYLALMVIRSKWIKLLRDLVSNILAIAFFVILLNVYPFAFGGSWDILEHLMKPIIYIFIALISIAIVVDIAKFLAKLAKLDK
jgi:hypothetical protein